MSAPLDRGLAICNPGKAFRNHGDITKHQQHQDKDTEQAAHVLFEPPPLLSELRSDGVGKHQKTDKFDSQNQNSRVRQITAREAVRSHNSHGLMVSR